MRTFRSAVELNRNFKTRKAIEEFLEKSGHATNAFAGGKFNPKPVQSRWQKFGLLSSVVTGYIDLGLDLQVTVSWFNEGKRDLFALSVAAMLVPILIQWAFIDKSTSRRAQSFFQVKLAVDGWNSFNEEMVTPGFAAAKFAEGVYEASAVLVWSSIVIAEWYCHSGACSVLGLRPLSIGVRFFNARIPTPLVFDVQLKASARRSTWRGSAS